MGGGGRTDGLLGALGASWQRTIGESILSLSSGYRFLEEKEITSWSRKWGPGFLGGHTVGLECQRTWGSTYAQRNPAGKLKST